MWQRFTEEARIAVYAAQQAAQEAGSSQVEPEHLLLGLLAEEQSVAVRVLAALGVEAARLRSETERAMPSSVPGPTGDMTISLLGKTMIDLACEEARGLGNGHIGTEHLLLAGIGLTESVAGRACATLGLELENARLAVEALQAEDGNRPVSGEKTGSSGKSNVWDRFDEPARQAIHAANEEAKRLGQSVMSPDHFLTGLLADPASAAVRALRRLGVDVDALRLANLRLGRSDGPPRTQGTGYSPASNAAFLLAYEERRRLRMPKVGPEHLLLGLLREPDGVAGRVLTQFGVELEVLREALLSPDDESAGAKQT